MGPVTQQSRDAVILQHIPMTKKLIWRFKSIYPNHADEIESAANYALVYAVQRICEGLTKTDYHSTYIYAVIRENIVRGINNDHLIPIPRDAYLKGLKGPEVQGLEYRAKTGDDDGEDSEITNEQMSTQDDSTKLFVREFLSKLTLEEREVLILRSEGYTLQEMATKLGLKCHQRVTDILKRVEEKAKKELCNGRQEPEREENES